MKKILASAAVISLIVTPSVTLAQHGSDGNSGHGDGNNMRQEDRQQGRQQDQEMEAQHQRGGNAIASAVQMGADQALGVAHNQHPDKTVSMVEMSTMPSGSQMFTVHFNDGTAMNMDMNGQVMGDQNDDNGQNAQQGEMENENEANDVNDNNQSAGMNDMMGTTNRELDQ